MPLNFRRHSCRFEANVFFYTRNVSSLRQKYLAYVSKIMRMLAAGHIQNYLRVFLYEAAQNLSSRIFLCANIYTKRDEICHPEFLSSRSHVSVCVYFACVCHPLCAVCVWMSLCRVHKKRGTTTHTRLRVKQIKRQCHILLWRMTHAVDGTTLCMTV